IGLLILESVLGGLAATVLGLLLGILLSRLLIGVVTPFGTAAPSYTEVVLTPGTIVGVTILSAIFMALVSYRSAKRTASLPIVETLRHYAPGETRIHYSPVTDIGFVGYSLVCYFIAWYTRFATPNFFIFMIAFIFIASLPFVPIFLVIGSIRLLTRSTGKVYEWTTRLFRPVAKNLEYVISRNLSRNPRRSSNIAIIIALGLAFGIFIVSSFGTQQAYQEQSIRANIGADMAVYSPYSYNGTPDAGFAANLSKIPGISGITNVTLVSAQPSIGYPQASQGTTVVALDPSAYFAVSKPEAFYFESPASQVGAQSILETKGQVLVSGQFAKDASLQVGDLMSLFTTVYSNGSSTSVSIRVTVGGIVRFLPGTYSGSFYGAVQAPDMVYGSRDTLAELIAANQASGFYFYGTDRYLIALQPGADWHTVKQGVEATGGMNVEVYQEQLDQLENNAFLSSFLGFVKIEIAFIVVILTAGLGLIIYVASLERDVEFAGIIARGSSGWQTAGLLVGEAFSIMVIGVIIGFVVGLATGYLSVTVTGPSLGNGAELIVPYFFVFPLDGLLLLVLAPAAMLGTAVLVSWRIAHMNVAQVLKMRGG
ncbi:MAG: ABC transporter permease, partial [Thermoplasmata archaeon]